MVVQGVKQGYLEGPNSVLMRCLFYSITGIA